MCFITQDSSRFGFAEVSPQLRFQSLARPVSEDALVLRSKAERRRNLLR
jgi:hypothetical protein